MLHTEDGRVLTDHIAIPIEWLQRFANKLAGQVTDLGELAIKSALRQDRAFDNAVCHPPNITGVPSLLSTVHISKTTRRGCRHSDDGKARKRTR